MNVDVGAEVSASKKFASLCLAVRVVFVAAAVGQNDLGASESDLLSAWIKNGSLCTVS
jgi:hypothetical protein